MKTIKQLLEKHVKVKVDRALAVQIRKFKIKFVSNNSEILGSGLIGHVDLFFKTSDENYFLNEILDIDPVDVRKDYKYIEAIEPSWKVTSDVLNLCWIYLVHRFNVSSLPTHVKKQAMVDILHLYNFRTLAAIHSNSFRYLISKQIAQATYEKLSNRFILKRVGDWFKYMDYRATKTLSKKSSHFKTLKKFGPDKDVLKILSDTQGRVRSTFILYYKEFLKVKEQGAGIGSDGMEVIIEGEASIQAINSPVTEAVSRTVKDMRSIDDFLDVEVLKATVGIFPSLTEHMLVQTIEYIAEHAKKKKIKEFVTRTLIHDYKYLQEAGDLQEHGDDLPYLSVKIRGMYTSSRTTTDEVREIRDIAEKLARKVTGRVNKQAIASVRNGILLYLFIFSFKRK